MRRGVDGQPGRDGNADPDHRGAGNRISVECKTEQDGSRRVLTDLQIALYGAVDEASDLGELIHNARPQGSNAGQCPSVIVDRAGL